MYQKWHCVISETKPKKDIAVPAWSAWTPAFEALSCHVKLSISLRLPLHEETQVTWRGLERCSGWQLPLGSQVAACIYTRHEWKCQRMVPDPSHWVPSSLHVFLAEAPDMLEQRGAVSAVLIPNLWPTKAVTIIKWLLFCFTISDLVYYIAVIGRKAFSFSTWGSIQCPPPTFSYSRAFLVSVLPLNVLLYTVFTGFWWNFPPVQLEVVGIQIFSIKLLTPWVSVALMMIESHLSILRVCCENQRYCRESTWCTGGIGKINGT